MNQDHLKNTLKDLHSHLESAASVDAELKDLLQVLNEDIGHLLARENQATPENAGLAERAQELSAKFAAQHPQLETLLRQLANTLENMGI